MLIKAAFVRNGDYQTIIKKSNLETVNKLTIIYNFFFVSLRIRH